MILSADEQMRNLTLRVKRLEDRLSEMERVEELVSNPWKGQLSHSMDGVSCQGTMRCQGETIVIGLGTRIRETLEEKTWVENWDYEKGPLNKTVALRLQLPAQDAGNMFSKWTEYEIKSEIHFTDIVRGRISDEEGNITDYELVNLSETCSDLASRMEQECPDSSLNNPLVMLAKLCLRKGDYARIHLSKGWSNYMIKGGLKHGVTCELDICMVNVKRTDDGLRLPMRCNYDMDERRVLKVFLPSWFRYVVGNRMPKFKEYICKIINAYQFDEDPEIPNAHRIDGNEIILRKRKGRSELRYRDTYNLDERIPVGEGIIDIELKL